MTPRDHLRAAMADRRTGRLHHRGTGVTVYLFDGEIVAADAPDDGKAVIAALRSDVAVPKFAIDHVAKRIDDGADWLGALAAGIEAPPLDAALIERFRHNLAAFCAAQGPLDSERDRTGIPVNLQQGVDLQDIVGDLPPRPRDAPASTPSMAPPPVPKSLRGATPRVADVTPPPAGLATTSKIPPAAPPAGPAPGINPTVVAVVLLPIVLVLVFAVSLLSGVMDGGASTRGTDAPATPAVATPTPPPVTPPPASDVPIMPDPPTPSTPPTPPTPTEGPADPATDPVAVPPTEPVAPPRDPPKPPPRDPPRDKPRAVENLPASHFFGEWRGTVSGRTSGVVVQVGEGTSLTGVFWTNEGTGRKEVPVTGAIKGQAVRFEGPGVALVMQVEGWQLVGRCTTPTDTSATACLLVKQ